MGGRWKTAGKGIARTRYYSEYHMLIVRERTSLRGKQFSLIWCQLHLLHSAIEVLLQNVEIQREQSWNQCKTIIRRIYNNFQMPNANAILYQSIMVSTFKNNLLELPVEGVWVARIQCRKCTECMVSYTHPLLQFCRCVPPALCAECTCTTQIQLATVQLNTHVRVVTGVGGGRL